MYSMRVTSSRELSGYVVHVNLNKAPEGNSIIVTLACKVYLLKGNEFGLGHWKKTVEHYIYSYHYDRSRHDRKLFVQKQGQNWRQVGVGWDRRPFDNPSPLLGLQLLPPPFVRELGPMLSESRHHPWEDTWISVEENVLLEIPNV